MVGGRESFKERDKDSGRVEGIYMQESKKGSKDLFLFLANNMWRAAWKEWKS